MNTVLPVRWSLALLIAALPVMAMAADPADPAAEVAEQNYESPLQGYQRWEYQVPGDWRAANDRVAEIGGWQAYAAEVWEASRRAESTDSSDDADDAAHPHGHH